MGERPDPEDAVADSERLALADKLEQLVDLWDESPGTDAWVITPESESPGWLRAAAAALREAEPWRESAMARLAEWDAVFDALGRPGPLGASKAESALREVKRAIAHYMRNTDALIAERDAALAEVARLRKGIEQHRDSVMCCDECATAVTEDRIDDDGVLWALLVPAVPNTEPEGDATCPDCGDNGDCGETAAECGHEFHGDGRH